MGYRIIYGTEKRRFVRSRMGKFFLVFSVLICALLAVWYISGANQDLNTQALENMVQAVRGGEAVSDAITAFCKEIIDNAQAL